MTAPAFGVNTDNDDMPYSDNDIQHDNVNDDAFTEFVASDEPLPDDDGSNPYDEFLSSEQPPLDDVDPELLNERKRTPKAKQYERKAKGLFSVAVKVTVGNPATVADSAALLMHGPNVAEKLGDLAADNARVARALDMLTDQTENAATALIIAAAPLALQIIRNHEGSLTDSPARAERSIRIPFSKRRLRLRFKLRLPKRARNLTNDPQQLSVHVFSNPQIQEALRKQGINVVIG